MNIIKTNLQFKAMTKRTKTEDIFLHHAAASVCTVEDIHRWHLNKGWARNWLSFPCKKRWLNI